MAMFFNDVWRSLAALARDTLAAAAHLADELADTDVEEWAQRVSDASGTTGDTGKAGCGGDCPCKPAQDTTSPIDAPTYPTNPLVYQYRALESLRGNDTDTDTSIGAGEREQKPGAFAVWAHSIIAAKLRDMPPDSSAAGSWEVYARNLGYLIGGALDAAGARLPLEKLQE